jgi:thioredoxin 1
MKKIINMKTISTIAFGLFAVVSLCFSNEPNKTSSAIDSSGKVVHLTNDMFKKSIYNYDANKQWKFEGTKPVIIDFYASWCGPCRKMAPIIEQIAKEYAGQVVVYKVDTDAETLLSQKMGISSLPTLLFIPVSGQPQASLGLIPKESIVKAINEVLLLKK